MNRIVSPIVCVYSYKFITVYSYTVINCCSQIQLQSIEYFKLHTNFMDTRFKLLISHSGVVVVRQSVVMEVGVHTLVINAKIVFT